MNKPSAKGWCPSTLIPMKSGDGLLIRIKPPFSRLTSRQAQRSQFYQSVMEMDFWILLIEQTFRLEV